MKTSLLALASLLTLTTGFTPSVNVRTISTTPSTFTLQAGGFEWEDPSDAFDQGVDNPFKNPDLMKDAEGNMKVDPARLLGPRLQGSNLYFIGMMGSGKSAVGNVIARREYIYVVTVYIYIYSIAIADTFLILVGMGTYNFLDTDDIIEKAAGMSIPDIFESEGEEAFREAEAQILDSVHAYVRCVVSTGGGIVCRMQNWSKLQTGIVVYLQVEPEVIMKRIEGTDRPLLQTENPLETMKNLMEERKERYGQADITIEITAEMNEDDVADTVVKEIHDFIDDNPPAWKKAKAKAQAEGLDWVQ